MKPTKPSLSDLLADVLKGPARHPKCKGYTMSSMQGAEYDCGYNTVLDCEQCKYGGGTKNPEAKRNRSK